MKAIKLKKSSWHYKLAKLGGLDQDYEITNLCEYTDYVLWGILVVSLVAGVAVLALHGTSYLLAALAVLFQTGMCVVCPPTSFTGALIIFTGAVYLVVAAVGVLLLISKMRDNYRQRKYAEWEAHLNHTPVQRSFISLAWQSFKEKMCVRIELSE